MAKFVLIILTGIWDLVMDWSLVDPYSHYRLLRDHLAFKRIWMYYAAMIIDPILRFNWIFYAIYANDVQHSAILSFLVALSEIVRRGIWTIFRVENEHCTNVGRFRASRDVPLPYKIRKTPEQHAEEGLSTDAQEMDEDEDERDAREEERRRQGVSISPSLSRSRSTGVDLSRQRTQDSTASLSKPRRRRKPPPGAEPSPLMRGLGYVGSLLHTAHAQDFERKKKPAPEGVTGKGDKSDTDEEYDDEGEGTDQEEALDEEAEVDRLIEAVEEAEEREQGEASGSGSAEREALFSFQPRRQPVDEELGLPSDDGDDERDGVQSPGGTVRRSKRKAGDEE